MGWTKLSIIIMVLCVAMCFAMSNSELDDFEDYLIKTSQLTPSLKQGTGDFDDRDDEAISDNAWEESGKFEGDLILNERQRHLIVQNVAEQGLARNGVIDGAKRWPDNMVIFAIQVEHFSHDQVRAILNGIDDLARVSCVKFRRYRAGDRDAVVIQGNRRGCFSQVGYQGGFQALNLYSRHPVGRGCFRHGTVVHELLHTLGFYHMQSSPDRDDYVDIIWNNILKTSRHNFRKYNTFTVSDFGVGYDYDSVLHYSRNAFTVNGKPTIVPKQSGAQIGQRVGLSDKDTQKLNKMYCDADFNSEQSIEDSTEKSKKKSVKNQPFDGHGLGYHKGVAVVFKLLPEAETYQLTEVPSSHIFDDFSKGSKFLSSAEKDDFHMNEKTEYSYKPDLPVFTEKYNKPLMYDAESERTMKKESEPHVELKIADVEKLRHANDKRHSKDGSKKGLPVYTLHESYREKHTPELIEALDRLTKIIKAHVYPSQTPDLRIYKMSDMGNDKKLKKEKDYSSLKHMTDSMFKGETEKETMNMYDHMIPKISTTSYYNEPMEKKSKQLALTIPKNSDRHERYLENFYKGYPEDKFKKYASLDGDEKESLSNFDRWVPPFSRYKYTPYKDTRESFLGYTKHRSKGGDHNDEILTRFKSYDF